MDGSGTAVVRVPVQLRGPAGNLFSLPPAQGGDALERRATGVHRLLIHVGVRSGSAVRRNGGRSFPPKARNSRRPDLLVADYSGDSSLHTLLASGCVSGAGGIGRGLLFPSLDVADQRVAWEGDAVASDVVASIQRLRGDNYRRGGGGIPGAALRLAARILRVRFARCGAGVGACVSAEGAGNGGGSRGNVSVFPARGWKCSAIPWRWP